MMRVRVHPSDRRVRRARRKPRPSRPQGTLATGGGAPASGRCRPTVPVRRQGRQIDRSSGCCRASGQLDRQAGCRWHRPGDRRFMMGEAASCIEQPGPPKRDLQLSNKAEPRPPALFRHGGNLSPRLWNGYRREWSGVAIAGGQRVRIGSTLDLDDLACNGN